MYMKHLLLSFLALLLTCTDAYAASDEQRGMYFDKKVYTPSKLPSFEEARNALPSPIWDENPEWVELYWKAWEIAFSNLQSPLRQRTTSLIREGDTIIAESTAPYTLVVNGVEHKVN